MSLRNKLLSVPDVQVEPVFVPEWAETVHVKTLSGADRAKIQAKVMDCSKTGRWAEGQALCVLLGVCEPNGQRVFNDSDLASLMDRNGTVIEKLAEKVAKLNGLSREAVDEAKKESPPNQN